MFPAEASLLSLFNDNTHSLPSLQQDSAALSRIPVSAAIVPPSTPSALVGTAHTALVRDRFCTILQSSLVKE